MSIHNTDPLIVENRIRDEAAQHGFDATKFARATPAAGIEDYDRFLNKGLHGTMDWMVNSRGPRADPRKLLPTVETVVVLGMRYEHPRPPDPGGLTGKVACYAWGRDYHNLIGKRLRRMTRNLRRALPGLETYAGVDSRPIIERAWAQRAGMGFPGKNALAILPGTSSYLFLASILINASVSPTPPLADHCGTCRRCLDGCPTGAFLGPGQLDARRCISYLTIEHKGPIPHSLMDRAGRWVFGCDDCQEVCPHNPASPPSADSDFAPRPGHAWMDLEWVLTSSDGNLMKHFQGSPIRRAGAAGLKRNAAMVIGNLQDPAGRTALLSARNHPDPGVQHAIAWALDRIG